MEENAFRFLIHSATCGVTKTQTLRTLEKEYGCTNKDIEDLLKIAAFKTKPKWINYNDVLKINIPKNAIKHPYPFTQIYTIDNYLSQEECDYLIKNIKQNSTRSGVCDDDATDTISDIRTSSSSFIDCFTDAKLNKIDQKMCYDLGLDLFNAEIIQGLWYKPGEYYKGHYDYFYPFTKHYKTYCEWMGQRTWTFMVYLNDVEEGGETYFERLNLKIKPKAGRAILWCNLFPLGIPNPKTLHEAFTPISNDKFVITKWFRSWSLI